MKNQTDLEKIIDNKIEEFEYKKDSNIEVDSNVDWYLAYYIYNFLKGKSKKLPNYEFIDDVMSSEQEIISMGYGIRIDKHLHITCADMITHDLERIDIITPTDYKAYTTNNLGEIKDIDLEHYSRFDKNRVDYLQQYLYEYYDYKKEFNIVKEKVR